MLVVAVYCINSAFLKRNKKTLVNAIGINSVNFTLEGLLFSSH